MNPLIPILVQKTGIAKENIINILKLLDEGSTIPFIARYRKEVTGSLNDEVLQWAFYVLHYYRFSPIQN